MSNQLDRFYLLYALLDEKLNLNNIAIYFSSNLHRCHTDLLQALYALYQTLKDYKISRFIMRLAYTLCIYIIFQLRSFIEMDLPYLRAP